MLDKTRTEIVDDEIDAIATKAAKQAAPRGCFWKKGLYFVGDESSFSRYMFSAYDAAAGKGKVIPSPQRIGSSSEKPGEIPQGAVLFVTLDCARHGGTAADCLAFLSANAQMLATRCSRIVVGAVMPGVPAFPDGIAGMAEREYGYFLEHVAGKTPEIGMYLEIEGLCRRFTGFGAAGVTLIRFANVFSPDDADTPDFRIGEIIDSAFASGRMEIVDGDAGMESGITAVRNACLCMDKIVYNAGSAGKIYNYCDRRLSVADLKLNIFHSFANVLSLSANVAKVVRCTSNVMNTLRINQLKIGPEAGISRMLKRVVNYRTGIPFDNQENVEFYNGRIRQIQLQEQAILREIDRICRKHGIQYFLAGGTLLGQVRCKGPIPWDDDLDIGMLRRDYEAFKRVVEKELGDKYCYTCPYNGSGSHYTIDKVRIRDSFFSTRYSAANTFQDGVFVDVLVYDQTSNNAMLRNLQLFILRVITMLLEIKWFNRARRNLHYRFSCLALPFLRLTPFVLFHRVFDWVARWFENTEDAKYLIDTVGKKLGDGPMPFEGLKEVVYADFDGMKAPIPVDPVPYLTYAFGPKFIQQPPLSKRCCPHNFARIDLDGYLFSDQAEGHRRVDLRGELFEK